MEFFGSLLIFFHFFNLLSSLFIKDNYRSMSEKSCWQKFEHFVWRGKEPYFNKATVPNPWIPPIIIVIERFAFALFSFGIVISAF